MVERLQYRLKFFFDWLTLNQHFFYSTNARTGLFIDQVNQGGSGSALWVLRIRVDTLGTKKTFDGAFGNLQDFRLPELRQLTGRRELGYGWVSVPMAPMRTPIFMHP